MQRNLDIRISHPRNQTNGIQGRHASLHIRAQRALGLGFLAGGGGLGLCLLDCCCVLRSTGSHCAPDDNREESAEEEIGVLRVLRRAFQKHRGVREEGHVLVFPVVGFSAFERFKLLKAARKCRR